MRESCKGREKRRMRLKIFLAKTFRGFTTTASGSKFSDDSWDKIQDLTFGHSIGEWHGDRGNPAQKVNCALRQRSCVIM